MASVKMASVKSVLLQLHSVIGLVAALVLTVIGMTGAVMSFEDEIGARLNAALLHVAPRQAPMLTPDQILASVQAGPYSGKVSAITMTSDPASSVRVRFARNDDTGRPASIYVDPYDAGVLGAPRGEAFFATVRKLHRWLLLPGDAKGYGGIITGSIAIGLLVLLASGIVLRWPRRARSARMWLKPSLTLQGRGIHRSLHSVIGTWVLPIYLAIALTGPWFSFEWYKSAAGWLLARPPMTVMKPVRDAPRLRDASGEPAGLNLAWSAFLHEQGERYATAQLQLPPTGTTVMRIRSWPRGSERDAVRDEFRIDTVSGQLMSANLYADKTFGELVLANVFEIHRGSILGWPGKLAFMLAAALMPLFMITGFLLYLSRRRLRRPVSAVAPHVGGDAHSGTLSGSRSTP